MTCDWCQATDATRTIAAQTVCDVCGFPMVWSEAFQREWCAVYGDHPARKPSPLLYRADAEMSAVPFGVKCPHGRAA